MYTIKCNGFPLLDTRDEELILHNPKVKLAENAVGDASFTIYQSHPYYDKLTMLKSVFEISDEYGVIFRGKMTENTRDIYKGKAVALEGAMAFFNDSIVRPYTFPDDWEKEDHPDHTDYKIAVESGNIVEFYLTWLIIQHNAQVDEFQYLKPGIVTVTAPGNTLTRSETEYPNTWEEIKAKLWNSSLGGHLCIRYEDDGNYVDYLAEYTEVNPQGIVYGENLRDISQTEDGKAAYSAIIPRGAEIESEVSDGNDYEGMYGTISGTAKVKERLTVKDEIDDGDITDDIVKNGDMLYSKKAVAAYGWRYVPASDSLFEDITKPEHLLQKSVDVLQGTAANIPNTIEVKAVDLHCTDSQIRSFRMYKKIPVYIAPHDINSNFDITVLDIDILNPQNTNISAGKTVLTLTDLQEKQAIAYKTLMNSLATVTQVANGFKVTESIIEKTRESILLHVSENYLSDAEYEGFVTTEEHRADLELLKGEINASVAATYLTSDDLTGYATTAEVESKLALQESSIMASVAGTYLTNDDLNGYATEEFVKGELALQIKTADDGSHYSELSADVDKLVFNAGEIEIKGDNFSVTTAGKVTCADINITGGSVAIGDYFSVSTAGEVTCANIDITGGKIAIGDNFTVSTEGAVTCADIDITGGSISVGDNFTVTNEGKVTCGDIAITGGTIAIGSSFRVTSEGKIMASYGEIGGWGIGSSSMSILSNDGSQHTILSGEGVFVEWLGYTTDTTTVPPGSLTFTWQQVAEAIQHVYDNWANGW